MMDTDPKSDNIVHICLSLRMSYMEVSDEISRETHASRSGYLSNCSFTNCLIRVVISRFTGGGTAAGEWWKKSAYWRTSEWKLALCACDSNCCKIALRVSGFTVLLLSMMLIRNQAVKQHQTDIPLARCKSSSVHPLSDNLDDRRCSNLGVNFSLQAIEYIEQTPTDPTLRSRSFDVELPHKAYQTLRWI